MKKTILVIALLLFSSVAHAQIRSNDGTLTVLQCTSGQTAIVISNVWTCTTPAFTHALPADQTGNATSTFKMNGLGAAAAPCIFTPTSSGKVVLIVSGNVTNGTTANSATYKLAYGTGTPPANAAAATGTVISAVGVFTALTGLLKVPFSITTSVSGLALNTAHWFDLQIANITGGTAAVQVIDCTAIEL